MSFPGDSTALARPEVVAVPPPWMPGTWVDPMSKGKSDPLLCCANSTGSTSGKTLRSADAASVRRDTESESQPSSEGLGPQAVSSTAASLAPRVGYVTDAPVCSLSLLLKGHNTMHPTHSMPRLAASGWGRLSSCGSVSNHDGESDDNDSSVEAAQMQRLERSFQSLDHYDDGQPASLGVCVEREDHSRPMLRSVDSKQEVKVCRMPTSVSTPQVARLEDSLSLSECGSAASVLEGQGFLESALSWSAEVLNSFEVESSHIKPANFAWTASPESDSACGTASSYSEWDAETCPSDEYDAQDAASIGHESFFSAVPDQCGDGQCMGNSNLTHSSTVGFDELDETPVSVLARPRPTTCSSCFSSRNGAVQVTVPQASVRYGAPVLASHGSIVKAPDLGTALPWQSALPLEMRSASMSRPMAASLHRLGSVLDRGRPQSHPTKRRMPPPLVPPMPSAAPRDRYPTLNTLFPDYKPRPRALPTGTSDAGNKSAGQAVAHRRAGAARTRLIRIEGKMVSDCEAPVRETEPAAAKPTQGNGSARSSARNTYDDGVRSAQDARAARPAAKAAAQSSAAPDQNTRLLGKATEYDAVHDRVRTLREAIALAQEEVRRLEGVGPPEQKSGSHLRSAGRALARMLAPRSRAEGAEE